MLSTKFFCIGGPLSQRASMNGRAPTPCLPGVGFDRGSEGHPACLRGKNHPKRIKFPRRLTSPTSSVNHDSKLMN
jgi:hypothetical protein